MSIAHERVDVANAGECVLPIRLFYVLYIIFLHFTFQERQYFPFFQKTAPGTLFIYRALNSLVITIYLSTDLFRKGRRREGTFCKRI